MHLQDLFSPLHIRPPHDHLSVKPARAQDSRVKDIHTVGGRHDDDALVDAKAVHLHKELVQGLLSLIVAAAHTGPPPAGDRVDLIDENDTGRILLGVLKEVADTGRSHADEHFHKVGAGDAEEGHPGLPRHSLRQQGLSCSRRAYQEHALGNPGSHLDIFFRRFQEIHDLLQLLLLLLQACHLREGDLLILLCAHPGPALAKAHGFRVGSAILPVHHVEEQEKRRQYKEHRKDICHKPVFLGHIPEGVGHVVLGQIVLHLIDIGYVDLLGLVSLLGVGRRDLQTPGRHIPVLDDSHLRNLTAFHQALKFLIRDLLITLIDLIGEPERCKQQYHAHKQCGAAQSPASFIVQIFAAPFYSTPSTTPM